MWKPALNIASILSSILLLMDKPNPDDPLMADIVSTVFNLQTLNAWTYLPLAAGGLFCG
jgi:ubiquitin-protein ligase